MKYMNTLLSLYIYKDIMKAIYSLSESCKYKFKSDLMFAQKFKRVKTQAVVSGTGGWKSRTILLLVKWYI